MDNENGHALVSSESFAYDAPFPDFVDGLDWALEEYTYQYRANCSDAAVWSPTNGAEDVDTVIYRNSELTAPQAVRFTLADGINSASHDNAAEFDGTGTWIIFGWWQYHDSSGFAGNVGDMAMTLWRNADGQASDTYTFFDESIQQNDVNTGIGYHEISFPINAIGLGGMDDYTAISRIRVYISATGSATQWAPHRLDFVRPSVPGSCELHIDLNASTIANGLPFASWAAYNEFQVTFGIHASYASAADMVIAKKLVDMGHRLAWYAGQPITETWNQWLDATKKPRIQLARANFHRAGLPWDGIVFTPGGGGLCPWDTQNLIREGLVAGLNGHRTQGENLVQLPGSRMSSLSGFNATGDGSSPAYLAALILYAERYGGSVRMGSHLDTANVIATAKAIITDFKASKLVNETSSSLLGLGTGRSRAALIQRDTPSLRLSYLEPGTPNGTAVVTIQLLKHNEQELAPRAVVRTWVAATDMAVPSATGITDYSVAAGTEWTEHTANADYTVISSAAGLVQMTFDRTADGTSYVMAKLGGRVYSIPVAVTGN